ncbi:MAG TPA: histidine triad nucleotide-binding protein [Planctomycetota bacterium]|nr:histidine triad nucleotide-binding protein [Planctomycetota bacterium]
MPDDCLFCRIAEEKIPATIVFSNDEIVAFRDINPQAPTHILVIPRKHIPMVTDLESSDDPFMGRLIRTAAIIARAEKIADRGFRLVLNCNREGGQTVFHLHVHLLGGRAMTWPPG